MRKGEETYDHDTETNKCAPAHNGIQKPRAEYELSDRVHAVQEHVPTRSDALQVRRHQVVELADDVRALLAFATLGRFVLLAVPVVRPDGSSGCAAFGRGGLGTRMVSRRLRFGPERRLRQGWGDGRSREDGVVGVVDHTDAQGVAIYHGRDDGLDLRRCTAVVVHVQLDQQLHRER
jgi:hypothetical protein